MSNVSRHMQPSHASGSAVKENVVLLECALARSAVLARKYMSGRSDGPSVLRRPAHQCASTTGAMPAPCRAVRPSAASAPSRMSSPERPCALQRPLNAEVVASVGGVPRPCEYAAPALLGSWAKAGVGHAAHAGGGVGSIRCMQRQQVRRSLRRRAVCEQNTVTANPSLERTSKSLLRKLSAAAQLQRYAANQSGGA